MTEEQLKENGYPMPHPEKPGRAVLFTAEEKKTSDCKFCWCFHPARYSQSCLSCSPRSFGLREFLVLVWNRLLLPWGVSVAASSVSAGCRAEEGSSAGLLCFDMRLWRVRQCEESHACQRTGTGQVVPLDKHLQPPPARARLVPARSVQGLTLSFGGCLLLWQGHGWGEAPVQHLVTLPSSRRRIFVSLCR